MGACAHAGARHCRAAPADQARQGVCRPEDRTRPSKRGQEDRHRRREILPALLKQPPPCPFRPTAATSSAPRPARRHPRRRNLAGEAKEPAHPSRLPARRAALHAHARHHRRRESAPGRPQGGDRLGAHTARAGRRSVFDDPPPARGAVLPVQAPGETRGGEAQSRRRGRTAGDQSRRRLDPRLLEIAGAQNPRRAAG